MNEVVKKEQTMDISMFSDIKSTGFEETSKETFKTPFVKILQMLSPELNPKKPEYLPEAKSGQFCNTATKQVYNELDVVVLKIEHSLLVWKPERGGFVGAYSKYKEGSIVHSIEGLKKFDKDGNDINDTISMFCMNANDPTDLFILSLSTTSLKYAKGWSTKMRMLKSNGQPLGVSYAGVWNIKTMEESNDKGSWNSIGDSAKFLRFITLLEYRESIKLALELLTKAETDYTQMNENTPTSKEDSVEY